MNYLKHLGLGILDWIFGLRRHIKSRSGPVTMSLSRLQPFPKACFALSRRCFRSVQLMVSVLIFKLNPHEASGRRQPALAPADPADRLSKTATPEAIRQILGHNPVATTEADRGRYAGGVGRHESDQVRVRHIDRHTVNVGADRFAS